MRFNVRQNSKVTLIPKSIVVVPNFTKKIFRFIHWRKSNLNYFYTSVELFYIDRIITSHKYFVTFPYKIGVILFRNEWPFASAIEEEKKKRKKKTGVTSHVSRLHRQATCSDPTRSPNRSFYFNECNLRGERRPKGWSRLTSIYRRRYNHLDACTFQVSRVARRAEHVSPAPRRESASRVKREEIARAVAIVPARRRVHTPRTIRYRGNHGGKLWIGKGCIQRPSLPRKEVTRLIASGNDRYPPPYRCHHSDYARPL